MPGFKLAQPCFHAAGWPALLRVPAPLGDNTLWLTILRMTSGAQCHTVGAGVNLPASLLHMIFFHSYPLQEPSYAWVICLLSLSLS